MADEEEKKTKPVNFKTDKDFHTEAEVMLEVIRDISIKLAIYNLRN